MNSMTSLMGFCHISLLFLAGLNMHGGNGCLIEGLSPGMCILIDSGIISEEVLWEEDTRLWWWWCGHVYSS